MWSRRLCALILGFVVAAVAARAADARFSQAITAQERSAIGLDRLDSDQRAILDALVRRDAVQQGVEPDQGKTFSTRLTENERKISGVEDFSDAETAQLDRLVARHQEAAVRQALLAPPVFLPRTSIASIPVRSTEKKREPEIHGSLTLSYGWGEDGYSSRSGSMVVNVTDPDRRYSVTIGYGETHVKGGGASPLLIGSGAPYYIPGPLRP